MTDEKREFKVELMLDGTHARGCFEYLRASLFALASACGEAEACTKENTMPCPED